MSTADVLERLLYMRGRPVMVDIPLAGIIAQFEGHLWLSNAEKNTFAVRFSAYSGSVYNVGACVYFTASVVKEISKSGYSNFDARIILEPEAAK